MDLDLNPYQVDPELADLYEIYEMYKIYKRWRKAKFKAKFKTKKRKMHEHSMKKEQSGPSSGLMLELKADCSEFVNYFRISHQLFQVLLEALQHDLRRCRTNFQKPIDPDIKLMLTLRYFATGETFQSLHSQFKMGSSTARQAVYDVCRAIHKRLGPLELPQQTTESLRETSQDFLRLWKYPHCIGALTRKRIRTKCPCTSSSYRRYKQNRSILLQAVTNTDGMFTFLDVGDYGHQDNAFFFKNSSLGQAIMNKEISIPDEEPILNSTPLPYVFISDETFPLMTNIMRPYPKRELTDTKRAYNHCHSQARHVVEHAFASMTSRWEVLLRNLIMNPDHAKLVVIACCILHNFVRRKEKLDYYNDPALKDIQQRAAQATMSTRYEALGGRSTDHAMYVRDSFANLIANELSCNEVIKQSISDEDQ